MGIFDNGLTVGTGLVIGVGALILAPAVIPGMAAVVRPLAKASIKSGMMFVDKAMEMMAEAREMIEDLTAEARTELAQEREQMPAASPPRQGSV